jgi:hypothetical protein
MFPVNRNSHATLSDLIELAAFAFLAIERPYHPRFSLAILAHNNARAIASVSGTDCPVIYAMADNVTK